MQFGYKTCEDYYRDASPGKKLPQTAVPILCLNAADDPFSPHHSKSNVTPSLPGFPWHPTDVLAGNSSSPLTAFPLTTVQDLPNVALLLTAHGGHIAFLQELFPRGEGFMERVFSQYVQAAFEHLKEINEACGINE